MGFTKHKSKICLRESFYVMLLCYFGVHHFLVCPKPFIYGSNESLFLYYLDDHVWGTQRVS